MRVGLLWHSLKSENLGVGALTISNIAIVEKVAADLNQQVSFTILGWRDPSPLQLDHKNVTLFEMGGKDIIRPSGLYRQARNCDFVLDISAGDSFADIYGARRFGFNILSKLVIFLARRPLVLSPQTIGPFKLTWARIIAKYLMRFSKVVITRDALSSKYVEQFKLPRVLESTDVAFRLPYDKYDKKDKPKGDRIKVGINVSGWLFIDGQKVDNMVVLKSDYVEFVRNLISQFLKIKDCEVHLVSHVVGGYQCDYVASEQLGKEFPEVVVAPRFTDPSAVKSYISGLDYFCGSRMHACIAAFSSGVPVVPIAYSRKFAGLFGTLGYNESTDLQSQTGSEIIDKVLSGFNDRKLLKLKVDAALKTVDAKLAVYENVIKERLTAVK
jgi:colanic acid/amylovoran biosynthesis protein